LEVPQCGLEESLNRGLGQSPPSRQAEGSCTRVLNILQFECNGQIGLPCPVILFQHKLEARVNHKMS